jgi:DNA repair exonuclease SbcCD ATPase subunit
MLVSELIEQADPNHDYYRYRMYATSVEYLKTKFPTLWNEWNKKKVDAIKEKIASTQSQIKQLHEQLEIQNMLLEEVCDHPLEQMVHSGYACSGSSSSGKYDWAVHEHVVCKVCGHRHSFETEATEEYRSDD